MISCLSFLLNLLLLLSPFFLLSSLLPPPLPPRPQARAPLGPGAGGAFAGRWAPAAISSRGKGPAATITHPIAIMCVCGGGGLFEAWCVPQSQTPPPMGWVQNCGHPASCPFRGRVSPSSTAAIQTNHEIPFGKRRLEGSSSLTRGGGWERRGVGERLAGSRGGAAQDSSCPPLLPASRPLTQIPAPIYSTGGLAGQPPCSRVQQPHVRFAAVESSCGAPQFCLWCARQGACPSCQPSLGLCHLETCPRAFHPLAWFVG